jgi:Holliday junction resolvasome RuvABC endonuclease subunit
MPRNKPTKILAIDPGTREMGFAILEPNDLIYYGVKTLKKKRPVNVLLKEVRKIINRFIDDYGTNVLVIETTFFYKHDNTSGLIELAETVKAVAKERRLKVVEYAAKTVRKCICESGKATKRETAKVICSKFPELQIYLTQDRIWKEKYWLNVFDAVALGLTYLQKKAS